MKTLKEIIDTPPSPFDGNIYGFDGDVTLLAYESGSRTEPQLFALKCSQSFTATRNKDKETGPFLYGISMRSVPLFLPIGWPISFIFKN